MIFEKAKMPDVALGASDWAITRLIKPTEPYNNRSRNLKYSAGKWKEYRDQMLHWVPVIREQ
jgi:hypothetical protein